MHMFDRIYIIICSEFIFYQISQYLLKFISEILHLNKIQILCKIKSVNLDDICFELSRLEGNIC